MTIITVISQQPLTTEQVNSFRSVPQGIDLTSAGDGAHYLADDGTYKSVSGSVVPLTFTATQTVHVLHNLNRKPSIDIYDQLGTRVLTDVSHPNDNEFYIYFQTTQSGSLTYS